MWGIVVKVDPLQFFSFLLLHHLCPSMAFRGFADKMVDFNIRVSEMRYDTVGIFNTVYKIETALK